MKEKISALVLSVIRYSDRQNILNLYTRERGRVTAAVAAGKGRGVRLQNSRLQPLSMVRGELVYTPGRDIHRFHDITPIHVWHTLYFNPAKSAVVIFLSEVLNALLREAQSDRTVWAYIERWLEIIDKEEGSVSNAHIAFLTGFLQPMGILPDLSDITRISGDAWFDMREGTVKPYRPLHNNRLEPEDTKKLPTLMRITSANYTRFKMSKEQRRHCLEQLINYYSVHYPGLSNLKSPEVLFEVF